LKCWSGIIVCCLIEPLINPRIDSSFFLVAVETF
jgi:hypothetical protein